MINKILPNQATFLRSTKPAVAFVGGIGSGKTWVGSERTKNELVDGCHMIGVASTYKQLKNVLFAEIKDRLRFQKLPFKENKADMTLELPYTGGFFYGFSADSIESARGLSVDKAIYDEATLYDEYVREVVSGRLRRGHRDPQEFFTTSPRGKRHWIYPLCHDDHTEFIHQTIFDNYFLPQQYIDKLVREYDGDFALQELYGEFVDGETANSLITLSAIRESQNRTAPLILDSPKVAGFDVARYGNDDSQIVMRQGDHVLNWKEWGSMSLVDLSNQAIDWVVRHKPDVLVIDGNGVGGGVVDILESKISDIVKIVDFNGGYKGSSDRFLNLRTETWHKMKVWVETTGVLPKEEIVEEMTDINYFMDNRNKLCLESKDVLRRRGTSSPDWPDALAMTFEDEAVQFRNDALASKLNSRIRAPRKGFVG
jgi:hypothetical protein